jgi:GGDEF domain-containing protein
VRRGINEWARENKIDFNVSIGLGSYPVHGRDLQSVIASVDKAMYRSKNVHGGGGILHAEVAPIDA